MAQGWTPPSDDPFWRACRCLPEDYEPFGEVERWADPDADYPDCSVGCRFFRPLHVFRGEAEHNPGYEGDDPDWGVCTNPASHRCGLLTFEHQGCMAGEPMTDEERARRHGPR